MSNRIQINIRARGNNQKEIQQQNKNCVQLQNNQVVIEHNKQTNQFNFDNTFDEDSQNSQIYKFTAFPLVESMLNGYNSSLFAYGQTGSGKTYTMFGTDQQPGIAILAIKHVIDYINSQQDNSQWIVKCSLIEIYNEKIKDLFDNTVKELKQQNNKVYVENLKMVKSNSQQEIQDLLVNKMKNRVTHDNQQNAQSSRSHAVFTIYIEQQKDKNILTGKFNIIDLAGSEKNKQSNLEQNRLKEGININKSLSNLSNVVLALINNQSHIPFRNSKLTYLLQDSIGGNCQTTFIGNISKNAIQEQETLQTLRFISRIKLIKTNPKQNILSIQSSDGQLQEIERLKKQLQENNVPQSNQDDIQLIEELKNQIKKLEEDKFEVKFNKQKNQELEKIREELNQKQLKEQQIEQDIQSKNNEIQDLNKQFSNVQDQNKYLKQQNLFLSDKSKELNRQFQDLLQDYQNEKFYSEEEIQYLKKQLSLQNEILNMIISQDQLETIKAQAIYNENEEKYNVPYFYIDKQDKIQLPSLGKQDNKQIVNNKLKNQKIKFINNDNNDDNNDKFSTKKIQSQNKISSRTKISCKQLPSLGYIPQL